MFGIKKIIFGVVMIGGAVLASIFGQTTFLTDIVNRPFVTLIILGKYVYDFFVWIGVPALGIFFAVIVEFFIAYFLLLLFMSLVSFIKMVIGVFKGGKK